RAATLSAKILPVDYVRPRGSSHVPPTPEHCMQPAVTIALLLSLVASSGASLRKQCNQHCSEEIKRLRRCPWRQEASEVQGASPGRGAGTRASRSVSRRRPRPRPRRQLPPRPSRPRPPVQWRFARREPAAQSQRTRTVLDGGCCPLGYPVPCPNGN